MGKWNHGIVASYQREIGAMRILSFMGFKVSARGRGLKSQRLDSDRRTADTLGDDPRRFTTPTCLACARARLSIPPPGYLARGSNATAFIYDVAGNRVDIFVYTARGRSRWPRPGDATMLRIPENERVAEATRCGSSSSSFRLEGIEVTSLPVCNCHFALLDSMNNNATGLPFACETCAGAGNAVAFDRYYRSCQLTRTLYDAFLRTISAMSSFRAF